MPDLPWFVYAIPFAFLGLIAFAAIYKYLEVRQAAQWPQTTGRVVISTFETRNVSSADKGSEQRNFARIVYEYEVSGQKVSCDRVTIGEDLGNQMVEWTIKQFPVGKSVTVYYNPRKPSEAVLVREVSPNLWGCVIALVVIGSVAIFMTFFGFNQLAGYVRGLLASPQHSPIVIGLATIGTGFTVMGIVLRWLAYTVRRWPRVMGRIETSGIDRFRGRLDSSDTATYTLYRPQLSYSYEYNGVRYAGSKVSFGGEVTANRQLFVKGLAKKYPPGKLVEVHVDPNNPAEAVLEAKPAYEWLVWLAAIVLWGAAIFIARQP